jgi:hypothetical protein
MHPAPNLTASRRHPRSRDAIAIGDEVRDIRGILLRFIRAMMATSLKASNA